MLLLQGQKVSLSVQLQGHKASLSLLQQGQKGKPKVTATRIKSLVVATRDARMFDHSSWGGRGHHS